MVKTRSEQVWWVACWERSGCWQLQDRVLVGGAEAKTEVYYYGQTKSDDEPAGKEGGKEVDAMREVTVGAEAKPEVDYYGRAQ